MKAMTDLVLSMVPMGGGSLVPREVQLTEKPGGPLSQAVNTGQHLYTAEMSP